MKILTDDPDWARKTYEARALAMTFVERHGRAVQDGPCVQAIGNGLTVRCYPNGSTVKLTIDARSTRVLSVEWKKSDAWRMEIETYESGRWESRLKAAVHPRPWLDRWRAVALFTASSTHRRNAGL